MKPTGIALIILLCLAPVIWLPGIAANRDVLALFSQYLGLVALIAMACAQIIATRWPGIEAVFGPLDQSYRVHKWLGIGAMVAVLLHDTIDAEMRGLGAETALSDLAETLGEVSLYGLLILVVITIATFIPYHLWKWTHRLIGIFFVLSAAHYLFILKPFANGDPLGLYMLVVCGLGTLAYAYTSAPRALRPSRPYEITKVTQDGGATAVTLTPKGKPLRHRAGQFAFFSFPGAGLPEPHPFTISQAPDAQGQLRLTVAPLGDLTARVASSLKPGQAARVEGPYGHFGKHLSGPQLWIGAGVGITPLVALAQALRSDRDDGQNPGAKEGPVHLVFAVRNADAAPHLDALRDLAEQKPNLTFTLWESQRDGRLTAEALAALAGNDLSKHKVLFCGPVPMRRALAHGLASHGVSARRFQYEAFEIRTGLGLRRLAARLLDR